MSVETDLSARFVTWVCGVACRYPVPYKKLSESRNQYTDLDAFTKGTVHQIHKETDSRDPREFVADEGTVCYR